MVIPFPDPDLEIRGGGHLDPEIRGGTVFKTFFSALRASVWSKNKGGAGPPRAPPVDPLVDTLRKAARKRKI